MMSINKRLEITNKHLDLMVATCEKWFENHKVTVEGCPEHQVYLWSSENSDIAMKFILSEKDLFISGDLGSAVFSFPHNQYIENYKDSLCITFILFLEAHSADRWEFNRDLALLAIDDMTIENFVNLEHYYMNENELEDFNNLKVCLKGLINKCSNFESYKRGCLYELKSHQTDWLDDDGEDWLLSIGRSMPIHFVAYWVALRMINEQLSKTK